MFHIVVMITSVQTCLGNTGLIFVLGNVPFWLLRLLIGFTLNDEPNNYVLVGSVCHYVHARKETLHLLKRFLQLTNTTKSVLEKKLNGMCTWLQVSVCTGQLNQQKQAKIVVNHRPLFRQSIPQPFGGSRSWL